MKIKIEVGFLGLLFLLFLGLRLAGAITWAWYWVASPLLAVPMVAAVVIVALVIVKVLLWPFAAIGDWRKAARSRKAAKKRTQEGR